MINVQDFSLRIGARELVNHVSFRIDKGMCIGLVGRNGAGKTTTMRLLAGEADRGGAAEYTGTISSNGTVGYLAQDTHVGDPEMKARDRIISVRGIDSIIARIRKAEHEMSTTEGARQQRAMERYVKLDQQFTNSGGWAANAEAAQIAHSLGLEDRVLDQRLDTLSGGQRRRVELARVLFSNADVLLLDEPTNHLDHDSIMWLRDWIKTFPGGVMIISHDVKLLGDTVNQVFYLDANRAHVDIYHLGWDAYLKQREEDERRRRKERANALKKAEHLKAQGEKMRAKATKAVAAQQMLRRAEELFAQAGGEVVQEKVARLRFPDPAPSGRVPLTAEGLSKSYGSLEVFTGVDLAIDRGSKVVVLGLNGAGKTTLLRLLSGIEKPDSGRVVPRNTKPSTTLGRSARTWPRPHPPSTTHTCATSSASSSSKATTSTSPCPSYQAEKRPDSPWPPSSSPVPTSCSSTNPPTTSIPPHVKKSSPPCATTKEPSSSSLTIPVPSPPSTRSASCSFPTPTRTSGTTATSTW